MTTAAAQGMTVFCYAQDYEQEIAFFEQALGIEAERAGPHWAAFVMGSSRFALHAMPDTPADPKQVHLDFRTDDIDASLAQFLAAGAKEIRGVQDEAWGKSAIVEDPLGRHLLLISYE